MATRVAGLSGAPLEVLLVECRGRDRTRTAVTREGILVSWRRSRSFSIVTSPVEGFVLCNRCSTRLSAGS